MNGRMKNAAGIEFANVWRSMDSMVQEVLLPTRAVRQCAKDRDSVCAEDRLAHMREGVRLMVRQFMDGPEYVDVMEAYDTGLSTGFYTKFSAIAQGFRSVSARRFMDMRHQHRRAYAISLRKIYVVGFQQGRSLALGLWDA